METATIPRQRRKEARPGELTAAALELFVERGFAATRLEDVAARAGVSKGTLYLYFDSKEALFKAVIEEGMLPVLDQGADMIDGFQGSPTDLLRSLMLEWWSRVGSTHLGGIPKLMFSEAGNFPDLAQYYHDAVISRGRALMRRVLELGIAAGEFRPTDIEVAIDVIFAPVLMLAIWRYSLGPCGCGGHDPVQFLQTHIDLALHGLSARSSA